MLLAIYQLWFNRWQCDLLVYRLWPFWGGLLATLVLGGMFHSLALGQNNLAATITEILDSPQVYIQNRQVEVDSVAQRQQQVRTGNARAALQFTSGAVARLAHDSSLVVGQCAYVSQGTLLVNGAMDGCSTSVQAGVRGTLYTLEVTEDGQTVIQVFEGEVTVQRLANATPSPESSPDLPPAEDTSPESETVDDMPALPAPGGARFAPEARPRWLKQRDAKVSRVLPSVAVALEEGTEIPDTETDTETVDLTNDSSVTVTEGQQLTFREGENQARIRRLTAREFIDLLDGPLVNGFTRDLPGMGDLRDAFRRLFPNVPLPSVFPGVSIPSIPRPFPF
jgi:hypothetical protein